MAVQPAQRTPFHPPPPFLFNENSTIDSIQTISNYFQAYPLSETRFGELGNRLQILRAWISLTDQQAPGSREAESLSYEIEKYALSQFPFLRNPSQALDHATPLNTLRKSYVPASRGIVIPAGKSNFRYCCHLIRCLRSVHQSRLPIQVAYAGETDLPANYRSFIESMGKDIETLNVLDVFDDATLDLAHGGWAIKPFAMLASKFEQTILADADAVFVQSPNVIFTSHTKYQHAGTLFFHDRLLWKGAFKERHEWWEREMEHHIPSETLSKSKVYNEGYAEEGDSGLIAMDKSRLAVFIGLLHVAGRTRRSFGIGSLM
jgi:alpha 1,3-mannosyltransferase